MVKEVRIPKEKLIQFIKREAALMIGVSPDQIKNYWIFLQSDKDSAPMDVIVDYTLRPDPLIKT